MNERGIILTTDDILFFCLIYSVNYSMHMHDEQLFHAYARRATISCICMTSNYFMHMQDEQLFYAHAERATIFMHMQNEQLFYAYAERATILCTCRTSNYCMHMQEEQLFYVHARREQQCLKIIEIREGLDKRGKYVEGWVGTKYLVAATFRLHFLNTSITMDHDYAFRFIIWQHPI